MSYCHNIFVSGFRQSRFLFGKAGEPSFKMLGIFTTAVDGVTPIGTITAGSNLPCSAGQTASVPSCSSGCSWQITGGTIQGSTTSSSISFTPNAATTVVTPTITNASSCSITTSKSISTQCGAAPAAPTNVAATATGATSAIITWT